MKKITAFLLLMGVLGGVAYAGCSMSDGDGDQSGCPMAKKMCTRGQCGPKVNFEPGNRDKADKA